MKITALLLGICLLSCGESNSVRAADGFRFQEKEYVKTEFQVKFVLYNSEEELQQAARDHGIRDISRHTSLFTVA
jgi:hypothetical protein